MSRLFIPTPGPDCNERRVPCDCFSRSVLTVSVSILTIGMGFAVVTETANAQKPESVIRLRGILDNGAEVQTRVLKSGQLAGGWELSRFRRLSLGAGLFESPGLSPLRILVLATGERIPVRQRRETVFRYSEPDQPIHKMDGGFPGLFMGNRVAIPGSFIQSVSLPMKARDVVLSGWPTDDRFWTRHEGTIRRVKFSDGNVLVPESARLRHELRPIDGPVFLELAVVWPRKGQGSLEFQFEGLSVDQPGERRQARLWIRQSGDELRVDRSGLRVALDVKTVSVTNPDAISKIRLTIDDGLVLSFDGRVLARSTRPPGRLRAISLGSGGVSGQSSVKDQSIQPVPLADAGVPVLLGCLIQAREDRQRIPVAVEDRLSVQTYSGDLLYGQTVQISPQSVGLTTDFETVSLDATEVRSVQFPRPRSQAFRSISGDICRVRLATESGTAFFGWQRPCGILGAVRLTGQGLEIRHSLLRLDAPAADRIPGREAMLLPWKAVREIEPLFRGEYRLLDAGPRHLGTMFRKSFSSPEPDGSEWTVRFELPEVPPGRAWLSLEVADLEPASEKTLRATPNLNDLRHGFLTTHVSLNHVPARTLNRHCDFPSPIGQSQRIRIPLPPNSLREGLNTLKFQQNPSRTDARVFDDCELSRIALEFDAGREIHPE